MSNWEYGFIYHVVNIKLLLVLLRGLNQLNLYIT